MNIVIKDNYNFFKEPISLKDSDSPELSVQTVNAILGVLKKEKIKSINEYFVNVFNSMNKNKIEWSLFLSNKRKKEYETYLKNRLFNSKPFLTKYFYTYFPERLALFKKIHPLDASKPAIYKHSSITGRLSIEKGINYLTMKKSIRNNLKSPFEDHSLYELDFKSCEPNLYCRTFNLLPEDADDIYVYIAKEIKELKVDRDKLKRVILSILYGANERSVSRFSGIPKKKIEKIKAMLKVNTFKNKLEQEFLQQGYIENMFTRPIINNTNLVNYWIQSSAADYCCLAFNKFFKENKNYKLHAVIHDAAIFSIPNSSIDKLIAIKSLKYQSLVIPVKINKVIPYNY
jgi:hypothetical protein